jgi:hypothetical protein
MGACFPFHFVARSASEKRRITNRQVLSDRSMLLAMVRIQESGIRYRKYHDGVTLPPTRFQRFVA